MLRLGMTWKPVEALGWWAALRKDSSEQWCSDVGVVVL